MLENSENINVISETTTETTVKPKIVQPTIAPAPPVASPQPKEPEPAFILNQPLSEVQAETIETPQPSPNDIIDPITITNETLTEKLNTPSTLDPNGKYVALTFDDGPSRKQTPKLLDILKENDAKATFFVLAKNAQANPEIIKRMDSEGHLIGNHSYNHKDFTKLPEYNLKAEIVETNDVIYEITSEKPIFMRPPYGAINDEVTSMIKNCEMITTLWTVDTLDWKTKDAIKVRDNIINDTNPGDIILLHDIYETSITGAQMAIVELKKQGYQFVTLEELINFYGEVKVGAVYTSGRKSK